MKKLALILTLCFSALPILLWQQITKQNKLPKNRPLQPNKKKKQKIKTQ